jgi:hypothetical protein
VVILALAVALDVTDRPARAGSLNPNPATATPIPGGYTNISSGTPKFVVNVTPNPALLMLQGNCPWLLPALSAQGFARADPNAPRGYSGANGWTINFATLQGSFTRNMYYPWADRAPAVALGGLNVAATNAPGNGGAVFGLTYSAGAGDPTGASAEWIQVVRTNLPGIPQQYKNFGYNAGGGYTYFIDDFYGGNAPANNGTMNPTYDGGYNNVGGTLTPKGFAANPTTFIDVPSLPLSNRLDTEFQAFLCRDNTATKTLTIYDGVWWGFQVSTVPEPSTWILLLFGCGIVVFVRRRDLLARRSPQRSALEV